MSTPKRRFARSSATSTCIWLIPERISSPGLLVAPQPQRRILLGEPADRGRDLLLLALDLRRDREAHHRLGEDDLGQLGADLPVGQQVAGADVLELGDGADVALAELLHAGVLLALQLQQRPHPLLGVPARVDERRVGGDGALEDAEEVDPAGERVGQRLEDERGRLGALDLDRRALLRRRRNALDDEVEQRVRAEVLRRDAARDGEHLAPRDRELERRGDGVRVELLAAEVLLHQRLVGLDDLVEQLLAVLLRELEHLVGDRGRLALLAAVRARVGAHVEDVDDAR